MQTLNRYLIWDFDGTLGYREGGWSGTMLELLRPHMPQLAVSREQVRAHITHGFPWHQSELAHPHLSTAEAWWEALYPLLERAYVAIGAEASLAARLARQMRAAYLDRSGWRLFDDTLPTLRELTSRGWRHVVVSNHVPELSQIVEHLGLTPYIHRLFNSAEMGYEKPHPQVLRLVREAIPDATELWIIGDSMGADIAGAVAAGVPCILVRKHHPEACHCCADLAGVIGIVEYSGRTSSANERTRP